MAVQTKYKLSKRSKKLSSILATCKPEQQIRIQVLVTQTLWTLAITFPDQEPISYEYAPKIAKRKYMWATEVNWYFDEPTTQDYTLYKECLTPSG